MFVVAFFYIKNAGESILFDRGRQIFSAKLNKINEFSNNKLSLLMVIFLYVI